MQHRKLRIPALVLGLLLMTAIACNLPGGGPAASPEPPSDGDAPAASDTPQGEDQPAPPTEGPSETPEPTATATLLPTETYTPTPETPMVMVTVNTNCRVGPGVAYDLLGALLVGEKAEILGVASSGPYVIIENPDSPGELCWLWLEYAQITGNIDLAPLMTPPPTPTPEPFMVKSVVASVDVSNSTGPCAPSFKFTFTAEIEVNGPGDVTYKWERSDFALTPTEMISFTEAGKKSVTTTWTLFGDYVGWQQLHVLTPNDLISNQANFTLDCP